MASDDAAFDIFATKYDHDEVRTRDLYAVDVATLRTTRLTTTKQAEVEPAASPVSSRIAFSRFEKLDYNLSGRVPLRRLLGQFGRVRQLCEDFLARVAAILQRSLYGFARSWYRLRVLRVFRGETRARLASIGFGVRQLDQPS